MRKTSILFAILLSGCTADIRSTNLSDVDLSDMAVVQELSSQLSPKERSAFTTFVVAHRTSSPDFCGSALSDANGVAPATIGEAIELTLAREVAERVGEPAPRRSKTPEDEVLEKWAELISRRDLLLDGQALLRATHGPEAARLPKWRDLDASLADIDRELALARPKYLAAMGG